MDLDRLREVPGHNACGITINHTVCEAGADCDKFFLGALTNKDNVPSF